MSASYLSSWSFNIWIRLSSSLQLRIRLAHSVCMDMSELLMPKERAEVQYSFEFRLLSPRLALKDIL